MTAMRGMSVCIPVGSRAAVEFRRYDHRTPILTLRVAPAVLVTLTLPEKIDAGHIQFARQLARLAVGREEVVARVRQHGGGHDKQQAAKASQGLHGMGRECQHAQG